MAKKIAAMENVNGVVLNNKINEFIKENGLEAKENHCRLVKMVLRHHVHSFPQNIPFIAAVTACADGQNVVFFLKRKKLAVISGNSIASETKVGNDFEIGGVKYVLKDTLNGIPRYEPKPNKKKEY